MAGSLEKEKKTGEKFLGILGGMGPEAGLEFARILLEKTPASRDQDHLPYVLLNYPQVPDRTAFIMGKGPDPVPVMIEGLKILQKAGATHAVIPCNTAHVFLPELKERIDIEIYDMIQVAADFTEEKYPHIKRIGILATKGTITSGIYEKYFKKYNILIPEEREQEKVHRAIYTAVKRARIEESLNPFMEVIEGLIYRGAEAIILGCTEVETALRKIVLPVPSIKPMEAIAEKIINEFLKSG